MGQVHAYPCCPCRLGHGCVHLVETERDGAAQLAFDGTTVFIVPGIECRYDDTAFMLEKHIKLSGRFCVSLVNGVFFLIYVSPLHNQVWNGSSRGRASCKAINGRT